MPSYRLLIWESYWLLLRFGLPVLLAVVAFYLFHKYGRILLINQPIQKLRYLYQLINYLLLRSANDAETKDGIGSLSATAYLWSIFSLMHLTVNSLLCYIAELYRPYSIRSRGNSEDIVYGGYYSKMIDFDPASFYSYLLEIIAWTFLTVLRAFNLPLFISHATCLLIPPYEYIFSAEGAAFLDWAFGHPDVWETCNIVTPVHATEQLYMSLVFYESFVVGLLVLIYLKGATEKAISKNQEL